MEVIFMKTFLKVLAALVAIAGIVYVIATYGDKIVTWAKKLLSNLCWEDCCCDDDCCCETIHAEEADFEA